MSHKFIEVTTEYPTTGVDYKLLLQIDQIVQIRPETRVETEPKHDAVAVVSLSTGETLVLKNTFVSVASELSEVNMVLHP